MDLTVQGKHIEKAAKDIMKCLDGFSYREAMAVLERVSYKLKDNAIINLPSQEDKEKSHQGEPVGNKSSAYISVNTADFLKCMAIMHEIGKSMMSLEGEKIRTTINGGTDKTIIEVRIED